MDILAELATTGAMYLGEETALRVKDSFSLECLGEYRVKNVLEPIRVYQVHPERSRSLKE